MRGFLPVITSVTLILAAKKLSYLYYTSFLNGQTLIIPLRTTLFADHVTSKIIVHLSAKFELKTMCILDQLVILKKTHHHIRHHNMVTSFFKSFWCCWLGLRGFVNSLADDILTGKLFCNFPCVHFHFLILISLRFLLPSATYIGSQRFKHLGLPAGWLNSEAVILDSATVVITLRQNNCVVVF